MTVAAEKSGRHVHRSASLAAPWRWSPAAVVVVFAVLVTSPFAALVAEPAAAHEGGDEELSRTHLVHGIPDVVLDVELGEGRRLKGLSPGDVYPMGGFVGQSLSIVFKIHDTDDVILAAEAVDIPVDDSASLVLRLDESGEPELLQFDNEVTSVEVGRSRLLARHLGHGSAVDVMIDGEAAITGLDPGAQESADLAAGSVTVTFVPTGEDGPELGSVALTLEEADQFVVYALGPTNEGALVTTVETVHGLDVVEGGGDGGEDAGTVPGGLPLVAGVLAVAVIGAGGVISRRRAGRRSAQAASQ